MGISSWHLRKAIRNRCARTFTAHNSGTVYILASRIRTDSPEAAYRPLYAASDDIYLEVRDHGCGIAQELLSRVFDPYFTTREDSGKFRGIGLAIVWNQVNAFGGVIKVDSREGEGTTMRILLSSASST
jgi:signal transduction histidine kinase